MLSKHIEQLSSFELVFVTLDILGTLGTSFHIIQMHQTICPAYQLS